MRSFPGTLATLSDNAAIENCSVKQRAGHSRMPGLCAGRPSRWHHYAAPAVHMHPCLRARCCFEGVGQVRHGSGGEAAQTTLTEAGRHWPPDFAKQHHLPPQVSLIPTTAMGQGEYPPAAALPTVLDTQPQMVVPRHARHRPTHLQCYVCGGSCEE